MVNEHDDIVSQEKACLGKNLLMENGLMLLSCLLECNLYLWKYPNKAQELLGYMALICEALLIGKLTDAFIMFIGMQCISLEVSK